MIDRERPIFHHARLFLPSPRPARERQGTPTPSHLLQWGPACSPMAAPTADGAPPPHALDAARQRLAACPLTLCFRDAGTETNYLMSVAPIRRRVLKLAAVAGVVAAVRCASAPPAAALLLAAAAVSAALGWLPADHTAWLTPAAADAAAAAVAAAGAAGLLASASPLGDAAGRALVVVAAPLLCARWLGGVAAAALVATGAETARSGLEGAAPGTLWTAAAAGAVVARLADSLRRECHASRVLAQAAAAQESAEAAARAAAQAALSDAKADAAAKRLAAAKARAASAAQSEFMSLMCHEVRTPLNGCLASAEMLLETRLDGEQRELASTIRVAGTILLSTVSNFLDFFKVDAGRELDVVRADVDLAGVLDDVGCVVRAMLPPAAAGGAVAVAPPAHRPGRPPRRHRRRRPRVRRAAQPDDKRCQVHARGRGEGARARRVVAVALAVATG